MNCISFIRGTFLSKIMAGTKKPGQTKEKGKKDKGEGGSPKAEITVTLSEQQAMKIIEKSKVITIQDLARQTGVKISAANAFLRDATKRGIVKRVGGYSGHYIYQVASS